MILYPSPRFPDFPNSRFRRSGISSQNPILPITPPFKKKHHTRKTTHQNHFIPVKSDEIKQQINIFSQKKKCRKLIPKPKISTYHHHLPVFQFPYFWHKKRSHLHILHIPTPPPGADLQEIICQQRRATEGHLSPRIMVFFVENGCISNIV